jgi:hypothetical protein
LTEIPIALAGATPKPEKAELHLEQSTLDPGLVKDLEQLGIYARDFRPQEFDGFREGVSTVYDDIIKKLVPEPRDREVAPPRLYPVALARLIVKTHHDIFWKGTVYEPAPLKTTLQNALDAYMESLAAQKKEVKVDALEFRKFLEATPAQREALSIINRIRVLYALVGMLGLNRVERDHSELTIVRDIVPQGMTQQQLVAAIKGAPAGGVPRAGERPGAK